MDMVARLERELQGQGEPKKNWEVPSPPPLQEEEASS